MNNFDIFDGTSTPEWSLFKTNFDFTAIKNGWNQEQKLQMLISKLSGKALKFYERRPNTIQKDYEALCKLFEDRFDWVGYSYLSLKHLENITPYPGELIEEFKHRIEELVEGTFPNKSKKDQEQLVIENFINACCDEEERELVKKVAGSSVDAATRFMTIFKKAEGFLKHNSLWEEKRDIENIERQKNDVLCHTSFQNGQNVAVVNSKQFHIHSTGDTEKNHDEIDIDDDNVKNPKCKYAAVIHESYDSKVGVSVTNTHYAHLQQSMHAFGKSTVEKEQLTTSVLDVDNSCEFDIDNNNTGTRESFEFDLKDSYEELELNRHHADIPDVTESRIDGSMMDVLQKDTKLTDENTAGLNEAPITKLAVEIKHKEKEKVKKSTLGRNTTGFMTKKKLHDLVKANVKENDKLNRETTMQSKQIDECASSKISLNRINNDQFINRHNKQETKPSGTFELEELTDAIDCLAPNWIYKSNKDVSSRLKNRKHLYWIVVQDTDKKRCNVTKEQPGTQKKYVESRWILDATPTRVDGKMRSCCQSVEIATQTELEYVPFQKTKHTTERKIGKGVDNSTQTIETCIDKSTQTIQESQKIDTMEKPVERYKALTTKRREKKNMEVKEMIQNKKMKEMKKKTRSAHEYVSHIKVKEIKDQGSVCREQKNGLSKEGISSKWQRCLKSLIKIRKPNVKMMNNAQKLLENKSKSVDKLLLRKRERFKELPPLHL
ncbi:unnamed protein product [Mytilus edulis]|uniref:Uncharacterized protein n=1 Tax=Mytilus edulis TaxID=6550 RepID=A0A8S3V2G0_MYTED|nr:unnamed protein product [Mytilus edulis]